MEKERCWTQVGLLYLEKQEALFKSLHEAWEHPLGNPRLDIKRTVALKIKKKKKPTTTSGWRAAQLRVMTQRARDPQDLRVSGPY